MKVETLVNKGYTQAAFRKKTNLNKFSSAWRKKGYKVEYMRSSGPVAEGGYQKKAYYGVATKIHKRKRIIRRKPRQRMGFGYNSWM